MFDIPISLANKIYVYSNVILVLGAVMALLGTIGIIWSGGIRERYSDERISDNEVKTALAVENSEYAKERAAQLEKEAAQARLETETLKRQFAWRRLNEQQFKIISAGLSKMKTKKQVVLSAIASDPESMTFASDIQHAMNNGGFKVTIRPSVIFGKKPSVGIEISGPDKEDLEKIAQPFIDAGLNLSGRIAPKATEINILIGSKLPPVK